MVTIVNLPNIAGWEVCKFDPVVPRSVDRMEGRRTEGVRIGQPYWRAFFKPGRLKFLDFGKMDAFMMVAGDGGEAFRAHDAFRPRPMRHDTGKPLSGIRAGGGAFDGTATLAAIINPLTISVSGLPAAFWLSEGDYVELRKGNASSLHRIQGDAIATAGGLVTLSIRYALDLQNFDLTSQVRFEKPSCLMQIDPGSYDGEKSKSSRRPSFTAEEVFIP